MKIRHLIGASAAALALTIAPAPALAQKDDAPDMEAFAALGEAFAVEPLTPEQEARLPLAREVVRKILPEGAMAEVMGSVMDGMLGPMADLANQDATNALGETLGYSAEELGLDNDQAGAALTIIDPAWQDRNAVAMELTQTMMGEMMGRMEPIMRDVMSELYAIHFSEAQLSDINAFFATETGTYYARQNYRMASDPRIMGAVFSNPELIFGSLAEMEPRMEAALAALPPARAFSDLSQAEIARLTQLTGLTKGEIESGMVAVADSVTTPVK